MMAGPSSPAYTHVSIQLLLFTSSCTHQQSKLISYKYESSFIPKLLFYLY